MTGLAGRCRDVIRTRVPGPLVETVVIIAVFTLVLVLLLAAGL